MKPSSLKYFFLALLFSGSKLFAQWTPTGLKVKDVVSFTSIGNILVAGTLGRGIHRSADEGQTWAHVSSGDLDLADINAIETVGDTLIASTNIMGRAIYRSIDSGKTWAPVNSDIDSYMTSLVSRNDTVFAGTLFPGVYRSTDGGTTWKLLPGVFYGASVWSLLWAGDNIYAGTVSNCLGVWKSTNAGTSWDTATTGLPKYPDNGGWVDIPCMASNGNAIFAGTGWGGCYRSTNEGRTWDSVNTGLQSNTYIYTLISHGNTLYLGTYPAVYQSTDDGDHWVSESSGLPANQSIFTLFIHGDFIYASTPDSGVWKAQLSMLTGVNGKSRGIPSHYSLEQNYPNPFNPSTTINYELPAEGYVSLKIFNLFGQEVATLVEGRQNAGYKSVRWDGSGFASGVYFFRLRAGGFTETKKSLLLR